MSIIHKHIPRQSDIDKIVRNIETCVIHSLELLIQAQDLVKAYQHSTRFHDIYQYITDGKLPSSTKAQNCIRAEALNYVVINHFLFRIDMQKDKDTGKANLFLLVILEKYEPIIFNTYHDSLLAGHQGPYHTAMTIRQKFFILNLMNKVKRYIEACHTCLKTKPKYMKNRPIYGRIPVDYAPMQDLSIDIKMMPQAFGGYHLLLVITCDQTNFTIAIPLRDRTAQTIAEALIYRVIYLFGPPRQIISDEATEFTSAIIQAILCMLNCRLKVISPYNHGSSKCERQIRMISEIIMKHLWDKGQMWPLFANPAYAMNTFASEALSGLSPFQLVFLRDPPDLTSLSFPKIDTIPVKHREYYNLLLARAQLVGNMLLEWRTKQPLEYENKAKKFRNEEIFQDNQMVYLLAPHASALQTNTTKFKQDFIGPLFIDTALDKTHYRLKNATGLLLDGTYHMNHIKKGSARTPLGIVNKFDTYETALKNTLLNKFAIKTPNNKLQEVTLQDGSKELNYLPGTIMDYAALHS